MTIVMYGVFLHGRMIVLLLAHAHRFKRVALQGKPHQHEGKQQAGEKYFHGLKNFIQENIMRITGNIYETPELRKKFQCSIA